MLVDCASQTAFLCANISGVFRSLGLGCYPAFDCTCFIPVSTCTYSSMSVDLLWNGSPGLSRSTKTESQRDAHVYWLRKATKPSQLHCHSLEMIILGATRATRGRCSAEVYIFRVDGAIQLLMHVQLGPVQSCPLEVVVENQLLCYHTAGWMFVWG